MLTLSTAYLAPIAQYKLIQDSPVYSIDGKEHFVKQSHRNRTVIYGANGPLSLSIPLKKYSNKDRTEDIEISYEQDWQTNHWRSFESAYRNTAYFEFYQDDLKPFYNGRKINSLLEFNFELEKQILDLLKLEAEPQFTMSYVDQSPDWRIILSPKNKSFRKAAYFPAYQQVFSDQHYFQPNLSIIDLLFNLGPASLRYLQEVQLNKKNRSIYNGEENRP